jgi:dTDP-4-dehydrorhamnose reductase
MSPLERDSIVALIGANGMLATSVRRRTPEHYTLHPFDLPDFDMTDRALVLQTMTQLSPDVIINCAAYTNVDGAESEQNLAMLVNGTSVGYLAEAAREVDAVLVHISTDYVFDGRKEEPYEESDVPSPVSVYGRSKLLGEESIRSTNLTRYFIVRTSWLYGPGGANFVETILRLAGERDELRIIDDQIGSPTYTVDLADAIFNLLATAGVDGERADADEGSDQQISSPGSPFGVYHFANEGDCSWYEFACAIVEEAQCLSYPVKVRKIDPIATHEYPLPANRPANSIFCKEKYRACTGADIPDWRAGLRAYLNARDNLRSF